MFFKCFLMMVPPVHPIRAQESRHIAMASRSWWSDRAAASWWDGDGRDSGGGGTGPTPQRTLLQRKLAGEARRARTTVQLKTQSGLIFMALSASTCRGTHPPGSIRVNMSRLLHRVIDREGHVSSANQTTQPRAQHLCLTKPRVEEERGRVCWPLEY